MRENNRNSIEKCRKMLPQFTTMNVIDGQAGLMSYSSLIFYSLTIDNILNIIVLLILAGVSIAMLTGENGILSQAQNAKNKTDKATEEEKIQIAVLGSSIIDNGYADVLDEESFKNELANQFSSKSLDVVANGDGSFIITVKESKRKYYVNDDKTVINSDNIIEISTEEQLKDFRDDVNSGNSYEGKAVLLTDDITLNDNWTPIGSYSEETEDNHYLDVAVNKPFKGIFDGCNHTINNLQIESTDSYQGLFGLVIDGTIRDITIAEDSSVTGGTRSGVVVGGLYGFNGNIYNCINNANTEFSGTGGGIVGALIGQHTVYNCKNYGDIIANNAVGGIVGASNGTNWEEEFSNYFHKIINCANYGNITKLGTNNCGGIVGYFKGEISNCYNNGEIRDESMGEINKIQAGGIVGNADGLIENCYNTGNIIGKTGVGGIAGCVAEGLESKIINSYSTGEVNGTQYIGDILGKRNTIEKSEIINCYTKSDTFTAADLGEAFKEDTENENNGYPILKWQEE